MRTALKILAGIFLLIIAAVLYIMSAWNKNFDAPYPEIKSSNDPDVIAHGKYLVFGPSHCATCHVPSDMVMKVEMGMEMPLIGGWEIDIPPGIFRAPNLTPDEETGIGRLSDAEIARSLRYSVNSRHKFMLPIMPYQEMSDEDITAIISYLRTQEPVKHKVAPTEYRFLGKLLLTLGVFKPEFPKNTPPVSVRRDTTIAYGKYLSETVANCRGCHTSRDPKSGLYNGPDYAGGMVFEPDENSNGYFFVSPNLTPDKETGVMAHWNEELFIARFRNGRHPAGVPTHHTHMPWGAFTRMTETDLKAIYRYLNSLEPVNNKINQVFYTQ
jgi:mono/diheme cytochrome c family protein